MLDLALADFDGMRSTEGAKLKEDLLGKLIHLEHFVSLPPAEREAMIAGARAMGSPEELQAYVDNMPWQSPSRQ